MFRLINDFERYIENVNTCMTQVKLKITRITSNYNSNSRQAVYLTTSLDDYNETVDVLRLARVAARAVQQLVTNTAGFSDSVVGDGQTIDIDDVQHINRDLVQYIMREYKNLTYYAVRNAHIIAEQAWFYCNKAKQATGDDANNYIRACINLANAVDIIRDDIDSMYTTINNIITVNQMDELRSDNDRIQQYLDEANQYAENANMARNEAAAITERAERPPMLGGSTDKYKTKYYKYKLKYLDRVK